jgi:hypothetical protein
MMVTARHHLGKFIVLNKILLRRGREKPNLKGQLGVVPQARHIDVRVCVRVHVVSSQLGIGRRSGGFVGRLAGRHPVPSAAAAAIITIAAQVLRLSGGMRRRLGNLRRIVAERMRQLVSAQVAIASEHLATLVALVRLVIRVGEQMGFQVAPLVERALAHGTLVRTLLHVEYPVDGEGAGLAEPLPALGAAERLLFRVDVAVVPQMVLPPERLAAHVAREGSLVRVRPLVDEQVVGLCELSVAELADELLARPTCRPSQWGFEQLVVAAGGGQMGCHLATAIRRVERGGGGGEEVGDAVARHAEI